jgi:putative PIN family toxin of toxin-antitoxin system
MLRALRTVIDTSSLVSYALTQGELMRQVVAHWRAGTIAVLSSPATRAELAGVLARPAIRQRASIPLDELVSGLVGFTEHVAGNLELAEGCRDPKDDKFLACAVQGNADYLISSDRDLLDMRYCRGVAIVNPGQFLLALELYSADEKRLAARFSNQVLEDIQAAISLDPVAAGNVTRTLALQNAQQGRQ